MHLMQNAETIDRLIAQGECLLKCFHAEYEKDPAGYKTEFLVANSRAGATRCTRCTTIALKRSLTAFSSTHVWPCPIA